MASCGLVAEKTVVAKSNTILNQYIFLWTEPQPFEREAYDYVDLRSRRSLQPETPNSFGGVSGSGLFNSNNQALRDCILREESPEMLVVPQPDPACGTGMACRADSNGSR
jgi:hypothetical protein